MKTALHCFAAGTVMSLLSCLGAPQVRANVWPVFVDIKPGQTPLAIQCVPYARRVSGIRIFGDAWTWWDQAAGRYARGSTPKIGAIMALKPYGPMQLGHVAVVSRILDTRTVLLRHANWSPIGGVRGQIEDNVRAVDASPGNDWSAVRVWFAPLQNLGATHWPVQGFIYKSAPRGKNRVSAPQGDHDPIGAIIARVHLQAGPGKRASGHEVGRHHDALVMARKIGQPVSRAVPMHHTGRS